MTPKLALVRQKQFQVDDLAAKANQASQLLSELQVLARRLDIEIAQEEQRTNRFDPNDIAYSLYAKAARARRENLQRSMQELDQMLQSFERALSEARQNLDRLQTADSGAQDRLSFAG